MLILADDSECRNYVFVGMVHNVARQETWSTIPNPGEQRGCLGSVRRCPTMCTKAKSMAWSQRVL